MWTHKAGALSLNPVSVVIKTPLARKATGHHLIKAVSLEQLGAPFLVSVMLKIEYAVSFSVGLSAG